MKGDKKKAGEKVHSGAMTHNPEKAAAIAKIQEWLDDGTLTPTGEWVLPTRGEPIAGGCTRPGRRSGGMLESPTGEPDDAKVSSPVRRGAAETGP